MKIIYPIFCYVFFFLVSICSYGQKSKNAKRLKNQNLEISLCDDDGDGFSLFKIDELEDFVKNSIGKENDFYKEQILISTYFGNIISIDNPSTNITSSFFCNNTSSTSMTDIAINSKKEIFYSSGNLFSVTNSCVSTRINYNYSLFGFNSLSFDDLDNLYLGSGLSSKVERFRISNNQVISTKVWHDFQVGTAGGDFVLINNKIYVSWKLSNTNYRLYEVTVDNDRNYISHVDIGKLPNETYGLATEFGVLYGVTPSKLFKINLEDVTFIDLLENPNPNDFWYGATGLHEAFSFKFSTHLTLNEAENAINPLSGNWTNTIPNSQTLYIRIENSLTKEYDIVLLNLKINLFPNVKEPEDITICSDNSFEIFDFNEIIEKMRLDNSNITFTFYQQSEVGNKSLPLLYQSVIPTETIYVKVENENCTKYYDFKIINEKNPVLLPFSTEENPTLLKICDFDQNDNGYFNLDNIKEKIISNGNISTASYFLSLSDAENNRNEISNLYYLENPIQEIFIKALNENGCFSITNFFLSEECLISKNPLLYVSFPQFMTPNNDGVNDFWNISVISDTLKKESTVTIFNRFGKELFTFIPYYSEGWDGTFNGIPQPESDYWYIYTTTTGIKKTGHLSLKR